MQLTGDLYDQVIAAIRSGRRRTNDNRRLTRVGVAFTLEIHRADTGHRAVGNSVRMRDLSPTGVGFIAPEPLAIGERLIVKLPRSDASPLLICAVVRYCHRVADRIFRVGAQFVKDNDGTDYTRQATRVRNAVPL